jgi:hypothetical protein
MGKPPENFGESLTADHIITLDAKSRGLHNESTAIAIKDRATKWIDLFGLKHKTGALAKDSFIEFTGKDFKDVEYCYTDGSGELASALDSLGVPHGTSTPHDPQANGLAERTGQHIMQGSRTITQKAGMPTSWWPYAARHFAFSDNIKLKDGTSAFLKRHKVPFKGPHIPYGALVDFLPRDKQPKFGNTSIPGIFLGYFLLPGGRWKQDFMVSPLSEWTTVDPRNGRKADGTIPAVLRTNQCKLTDKTPIFPMSKRKQYIERDLDGIAEETSKTWKWDADDKDYVHAEPDQLGEHVPSLHQGTVLWHHKLRTKDDPNNTDVSTDEPGDEWSEIQNISEDDDDWTAIESLARQHVPDTADQRGQSRVIDGLDVRPYDGTTRTSRVPPNFWPATWKLLTRREQREEIDLYESLLDSRRVKK